MSGVNALIAVIGTLLGSTLTHVFQQRSTRRTERAVREEKVRQGRLDTYGAYAGLLVEFRQAMLHHWFCVHEGTDAADEVALRARSFELRSKAQNSLFQVQLITESPLLLAAAEEAFAEVGKIDRATDRSEVLPRRDRSRELIDGFVTAARAHV